jgi:quinol monooxygenase YgiN
MSVRMVRVKIRPDKAAEVEQAAKEIFAALDAAQPQGVHYASCKVADGETYVILLALDDDSVNPLLAIPAFKEFQDNLNTWIAGPPNVEQLSPVGSYNLF